MSRTDIAKPVHPSITIHPQPRLYSENLLALAERARRGGGRDILRSEIAELGDAVQSLVADLDAERHKHQVTTNQLEAATDMIPAATEVLEEARKRGIVLTTALASTNRDLLASIERERRLEAKLLVAERNLDEALARERRLVQAGLNAATIAVTAEPSAEVAAHPVPEASDNFDEPGDDRTQNRSKP
jgi:hypothetical protein